MSQFSSPLFQTLPNARAAQPLVLEGWLLHAAQFLYCTFPGMGTCFSLSSTSMGCWEQKQAGFYCGVHLRDYLTHTPHSPVCTTKHFIQVSAPVISGLWTMKVDLVMWKKKIWIQLNLVHSVSQPFSQCYYHSGSHYLTAEKLYFQPLAQLLSLHHRVTLKPS